MTWRLRVSHRTGFTYAGPVASSFNEARMSPSDEARQRVVESRVSVRPSAHTHSYRDYWDTLVTAFDIHVPHAFLEVVAEATVDTSGSADGATGGLGWAGMAEPRLADRMHEMLSATPRTALDEELTDVARELREGAATPAAAAEAVWTLVSGIAYVPGSTGVQTDAVQVWRQREGVCQDISHLSLGLLRALGVPARYVSGYLHPKADAEVGVGVQGQSHAWVEWFDGEWHGFDPTNAVPVGQRHIVVGRGRDYGDVPPLKGVYAGPAGTGQEVSVTVTRLR
jgi:transglutaminase-like putative cysteine protease